MANQPHNPQSENQPRKPVAGRPQKERSGQEAKPGPQPQDPAELGHDPKPAEVQAAGRLGQTSERSRH